MADGKEREEPFRMELTSYDYEEVYAEDSVNCEVNYPPCPTFSPSADDISRLKFVANDVVMHRSEEAEQYLVNDITTYLGDQSIGTGSILSEKDRQMYVLSRFVIMGSCEMKLKRMQYENQLKKSETAREEVGYDQEIYEGEDSSGSGSMVSKCINVLMYLPFNIKDCLSSNYHTIITPHSIPNYGISISEKLAKQPSIAPPPIPTTSFSTSSTTSTTTPSSAYISQTVSSGDITEGEEKVAMADIERFMEEMEEYASESLEEKPSVYLYDPPSPPSVKVGVAMNMIMTICVLFHHFHPIQYLYSLLISPF